MKEVVHEVLPPAQPKVRTGKPGRPPKDRSAEKTAKAAPAPTTAPDIDGLADAGEIVIASPGADELVG